MLEITDHVSEKWENCWGCRVIGKHPSYNIAPGTPHKQITTDGLLRDACCMDCFKRMNEGEEWTGVVGDSASDREGSALNDEVSRKAD